MPDDSALDDPAEIETLAEPPRRWASAPRRPASPRQVPATDRGSWWTRPDADFAAEADRMRHDPKAAKVKGALPIAWQSVF